MEEKKKTNPRHSAMIFTGRLLSVSRSLFYCVFLLCFLLGQADAVHGAKTCETDECKTVGEEETTKSLRDRRSRRCRRMS